jgi:REP element-mobilizing transposase RayT
MVRASRTSAPQQTAFVFRQHGGKRRGAGRKPNAAGAPGVSHAARPTLTGKHPVHVTLRVHRDVPNLRRNAYHPILMEALRASRRKDGFRLCHFVVMGNHLHLLVEVDSARCLARGIQGLSIRLASRMNAAARRHGRFFADRYHARVLRTPTEVHRAIGYVLLNLRKHEAERSSYVPRVFHVDAFSSAAWFDGFAEVATNAAYLQRAQAPPVVPPATWLLEHGWRKLGPICVR